MCAGCATIPVLPSLTTTNAHGWAVQGVERDGRHPPWAYTVGLTPRRRPELVVTGMGLTRATQVLNGMAAHLRTSASAGPGIGRTRAYPVGSPCWGHGSH